MCSGYASNIVGALSMQASLRPRLLSDVTHHVLDARVVLEAVVRQVFAVARVAEPTVWHFGNKRNVSVDPNTTEVETLREAHCAAVVFGPDR